MNSTPLSVIDRSVHFLGEPPELWKRARPAPIPPSCLSARVKPPSFPRKMKAPWGEDNVYGGVPCYQEPGKPWILGLGYFCGYGADTGAGVTDYRAFYTVSNDGGRTFCEPRPVICQGPEFNLMHPLPGAWVGKNSWAFTDAMLTNLASNGDLVLPLFSCLTTRAGNGDVIVPFTPKSSWS